MVEATVLKPKSRQTSNEGVDLSLAQTEMAYALCQKGDGGDRFAHTTLRAVAEEIYPTRLAGLHEQELARVLNTCIVTIFYHRPLIQRKVLSSPDLPEYTAPNLSRFCGWLAGEYPYLTFKERAALIVAKRDAVLPTVASLPEDSLLTLEEMAYLAARARDDGLGVVERARLEEIVNRYRLDSVREESRGEAPSGLREKLYACVSDPRKVYGSSSQRPDTYLLMLLPPGVIGPTSQSVARINCFFGLGPRFD